MLRQGPVPAVVHGLIEYVAGVLFVAAPFLFGFDADAAIAASIVTGVLVLVVAASTALPTGLVKSIPLSAHVVLDYVLAVAMIAAPFVLGFSDEGAAVAFFLVVGVLHLLMTIGTRFVKDRPERGRGRAEPAGS